MMMNKKIKKTSKKVLLVAFRTGQTGLTRTRKHARTHARMHSLTHWLAHARAFKSLARLVAVDCRTEHRARLAVKTLLPTR